MCYLEIQNFAFDVVDDLNSLADVTSQEKSEICRTLESYIHQDYGEELGEMMEEFDVTGICYYPKVLKDYKFLSTALQIRKNYDDWSEFICNPTKNVSSTLHSIIKDKEIAFRLAILDSYGMIHLDPSHPFITGECENELIKLCPASSRLSLEHIIYLWSFLERPKFNFDLLNEFLHNAYEIFFNASMPSFRGFLQRESFESIVYRDTFAKNDFVNQLLMSSLSTFLPNFIFSYSEIWKLDFKHFISSAALTMAVCGKCADTLSLFRELFPNIEELMPLIVQKYRVMSTYYLKNASSISDDSEYNKPGHEPVEYLCYEVFSGIPWAEPNLSLESPLYHRGALKEIQEYPEDFTKWKEDPEMDYLYRTLVVPALRAKQGSPVEWKL